MRDEKPNVTVVYQDTSRKVPGFLAILGDLVGLGLFFGLAALLAWVVGAL